MVIDQFHMVRLTKHTHTHTHTHIEPVSPQGISVIICYQSDTPHVYYLLFHGPMNTGYEGTSSLKVMMEKPEVLCQCDKLLIAHTVLLLTVFTPPEYE